MTTYSQLNHQTDRQSSVYTCLSTLKVSGNQIWFNQKAVVLPQQANKGWELPEQPRIAAEVTSTNQNSQTTKPSTCIITQVGSEWARVPNKCSHPCSPSKLIDMITTVSQFTSFIQISRQIKQINETDKLLMHIVLLMIQRIIASSH